ncbi:nucleoside triphosphate pyrophosphohydrolase [Sphingomonas fennica]|uniref:Nucleoside triphosphate pyrophosphohydrolase n=1 Tax=Edaphosphingomonas fennica TaxID=114404 RepID=A0A2T4HJ38_9SPHN|nr:nucleoside triphosphate pyrophosphohydrolase [Sphingomonas fennica]PTD15820.1 nucleoside triphosphate pyrophosphohydrolase [Sphingomonas fennica]
MLDRLVLIMERLRDPENGCPWDREQTFASIAPYTIEEAYEVADACARDDMAALKDELGDLLLQVVYHSRMAEERGAFAIGDVVTAICDKMIRRHPHVFGDGRSPGWEALKAEERRGHADASALAGVALGLPALLRAEKLQKRAARVGFDWPDADGPRAKIIEELAEVEDAPDAEARAEEIGDLLFAVVNWARHHHVDAEAALRSANAKFERRFRSMEALADGGFATLDLAAQDRLWDRAKAAEKSPVSAPDSAPSPPR